MTQSKGSTPNSAPQTNKQTNQRNIKRHRLPPASASVWAAMSETSSSFLSTTWAASTLNFTATTHCLQPATTCTVKLCTRQHGNSTKCHTHTLSVCLSVSSHVCGPKHTPYVVLHLGAKRQEKQSTQRERERARWMYLHACDIRNDSFGIEISEKETVDDRWLAQTRLACTQTDRQTNRQTYTSAWVTTFTQD